MADLRPGRFLLLSFGVCVLLLAAVAAFNWWTNPGDIFRKGDAAQGRPEDVLGDILASGLNIATAVSIDERLIRPRQIEGTKPNRGTLVMGSSRVMEIRADLLGERGDFLSNWVGGANLEDVFGLLELHLEHGAQPKKIVLGVDAWMFDGEGHDDPRSMSLAAPMSRMAARMNLPPGWTRIVPPQPRQPRNPNAKRKKNDPARTAPPREPFASMMKRYAELISWGCLSQSILSHFQKISADEKVIGTIRYLVTKNDWNENRTYRADGSTGYESNYRDRDAEEIEADAIRYATPPIYKLDGYTKVDARRVAALAAFLDFLRANRIDVEIYLSPYHPSTYASFMRQPIGAVVRESEANVRGLAAERGIPVAGSFDPAAAGCEAADFYDGMHLKKEAVAKVFSKAVVPK